MSDLPDTVTVEDEPLFDGVNCNDACIRTIGQVRLSPDLIQEIDFEYPFDVLPNEGFLSSGRDIFRLGEYGVLFHELDLSYTGEVYPWRTVWVSIPSTSVEKDNLYGDTVLYSPQQGLYMGMCKERPELMDVNIWDEEDGTSTYTCEKSDIGFFEIPDEVLVEMIPEEYSPNLVSQSI